MSLIEELSADDQAAFDAMRSESALPDASGEGTAAPEAPAQPASGTTEPAAEPTTDPASAPQKTVPLSALHEERERRKDLDAQLKAERERFNLVVQKFAQPTQPQPEAPKAPEIPDLATDPAGHILATLRATGMSVEQLAQAMQQNTQRQRESEAVAELQTYAAASEQQYRAETPDYDSAVTFLIEKRNKLLEAGGMIDPAQRLAQINREKLQLAHDARRAGKNPAAMAYEVAQIYGWAPQAAAAPAAADPAPEPNAGTEKLERVAAGQQQGRSLSNTRGGAPPATPPAQRIAEMAPDKFAALLADAEKNPEKMREIFGA